MAPFTAAKREFVAMVDGVVVEVVEAITIGAVTTCVFVFVGETLVVFGVIFIGVTGAD